MEIPSEILYINGIAMIAIKHGIASVISLKSIFVTDVSMDYIGGFTFNAVRNLIGALTLLPVIWGLGKTKAPEEKKRIQASSDRKTLITGGICCGILLCFASNFQQFGIKYTSVGKAGD